MFLHADSKGSDQTGQMQRCWFCHEVTQVMFVSEEDSD